MAVRMWGTRQRPYKGGKVKAECGRECAGRMFYRVVTPRRPRYSRERTPRTSSRLAPLRILSTLFMLPQYSSMTSYFEGGSNRRWLESVCNLLFTLASRLRCVLSVSIFPVLFLIACTYTVTSPNQTVICTAVSILLMKNVNCLLK